MSRARVLSLRLTDREYTELQQAADRDQVTVSDLVRRRATRMADPAPTLRLAPAETITASSVVFFNPSPGVRLEGATFWL